MGDVVHVVHGISSGPELRPFDLSHGDKAGAGQIIGEIAVGEAEKGKLCRYQHERENGEVGEYAGQPAGRCSGSGKSVPDLPPELPQGEQAKQIGEVGQSHAQQGQKPRQKPVCQKLCPIDSYRPMISGSSSTILARAGSK